MKVLIKKWVIAQPREGDNVVLVFNRYMVNPIKPFPGLYIKSGDTSFGTVETVMFDDEADEYTANLRNQRETQTHYYGDDYADLVIRQHEAKGWKFECRG